MTNLALPLKSITAPPSTVRLYHGDCLDVMPRLPTNSVAMIFADLPYGQKAGNVTANRWDKEFDLHRFWAMARNIRKVNAATICTAKLRFASSLIISNTTEFRHDLVYVKSRPTRHHHAKRMPLSAHENVLVFSAKQHTYNPQMVQRAVAVKHGGTSMRSSNYTTEPNLKTIAEQIYTHRYPTTVIQVPSENKQVHPTQKPVALLEWIIRTYTNPGDTVLDPAMGSGSCGVACARLGRNFIGIEKDQAYFDIAQKRIADERKRLELSND